MSDLDPIVSVDISTSNPGPTRAGFGVPLIAAYHTRWGASSDRVREYTSTAGMAADGFLTTDPAYQIAQAIFSQRPRVRKLKVGRRALAPTQLVQLTPEAPSSGKVYAVKVNGSTVTYTAGGGDNLAAVNTALAAAITALAGVTASGASGTHVVSTTDAAGALLSYEDASATLSVTETTTDPGIATDLAAIRLVDADWYGLVLDSNSHAEVLAAAAWAEANDVLLVAQTADAGALSGGSTTDTLYALKAAGYTHTHADYYPDVAASDGWLAAALLGDRLPDDPGTDTWAFKTLAGVTSYTLTASQKSAVHAKNGGTYTTVHGVAVTEGGKVAVGEWVDVIRGIDEMRVRMQERVFGLLLNNRKVPYTDAGADLVKGAVLSVLTERVGGLLAGDPKPEVTAPLVADVDPAEREARNLPGVEFSATLAGAVHFVGITGTVSA